MQFFRAYTTSVTIYFEQAYLAMFIFTSIFCIFSPYQDVHISKESKYFVKTIKINIKSINTKPEALPQSN